MKILSINETMVVSGGDAAATRLPGQNSWGEWTPGGYEFYRTVTAMMDRLMRLEKYEEKTVRETVETAPSGSASFTLPAGKWGNLSVTISTGGKVTTIRTEKTTSGMQP
ncbi:hypothetical protein [Paucibacter sp. DJ2R-2]|uniref:hypothetical protein n=1 Tax=Paucibacter sp. DJ2R-2 TaxID=2893558 RepID=UPI0021E37CA3|nr:hypothetical protein [Paucibacter sp. DJ2R-2]MCV2436901.1 hypothetical protein [Paucibacter sp. DJ2R-2]